MEHEADLFQREEERRGHTYGSGLQRRSKEEHSLQGNSTKTENGKQQKEEEERTRKNITHKERERGITIKDFLVIKTYIRGPVWCINSESVSVVRVSGRLNHVFSPLGPDFGVI